MDESEHVPAPSSKNYTPSEVILYGVRLNKDNETKVFLPNGFYVKLEVGAPPGANATYRLAAVYGYAFEGYCYRLDKPRLLLFPVRKYGNNRLVEFPAQGCGFEGFGGKAPDGTDLPFEGYFMWRVDMSDDIVELTSSVDTLEKLVLEANLPGKRSPNTYNNDMQMAHRGGRLTRT
jgi:hypothetical protein